MANPHVTPLSEIEKGWYMSWFMATQAGNNICVTLSDDSGTKYVDNQCRQDWNFGKVAEGFSQVQGDNVSLSVTIDTTHSVDIINHPIIVPNKLGQNVAQGYVLLYEDSVDSDYNDLYCVIMAWKSAN